MPKLDDSAPRRPAHKPLPRPRPAPAPEEEDDFEDTEPMKKHLVEDLLLGETPRDLRIRLLSTVDDEEIDVLKKWSCSFYQKNQPKCVGCRQPEDLVLECRDSYLEKIPLFPHLDEWQPAFDLPVIKVRAKIALAELSNIGVTCNSCYMQEKCPLMEKHSTCAIDFGTDSEDLTPTRVFDRLIEMQSERVKRQAVFEKIDGGVADGNLSVEMDRLATFVERKTNNGAPVFKMTMEGRGEEGAKTGGGILSKIFGPPPAVAALTEGVKTIDIPYAEPEFADDPKTSAYKRED